MTSQQLSAAQAHALFDILTHHETYDEIQKFKYPNAIQGYGPPFGGSKPSTSPILQGLLERFLLTLPGLRDVSKDFWQQRAENLLKEFGAAELSESYDKGAIGSRRTLATAIAALIEYPARGVLGGYPEVKEHGNRLEQKYDTSNPDDVMRAWEDFTQEIIHGDMLDVMFDMAKKSDKLEDHSSLVQGAHEFLLVNLAAFLHYVMILSPDGQYMAKVLENVHKLIPYAVLKPPLRYANAATMISQVVRIVLAKITLNTITSFVGLTNASDDGLNMMQGIVSQVIGWDIKDLKQQSLKIEKSKDAPSKEHRKAIDKWVKKSREEHDKTRTESQMVPKSIIAAIFDDTNLSPLNEAQHKAALEYLDLQLSIHDREQLSKVICYHKPDLVTQAVRDLVTAYEPIIRALHNAYDLSAGLTDFQNFLTDFIQLSKIPTTASKRKSLNGSSSADESELPSVEDYVKLLKKHQGAAHRFLHQFVKNGGDMAALYRDYAKQAAKQFSKPLSKEEGNQEATSSKTDCAAGALTEPLEAEFKKLSDKDRKKILPTLDAHANYLNSLYDSSKVRMRSILSSSASTACGPGMYLARWRDLMDATLITPATADGQVRKGGSSDKSLLGAKRVETGDGGVKKEKAGSKAPDATDVIDLMMPAFKKMLAQHA